jgi:hypothetical protein
VPPPCKPKNRFQSPVSSLQQNLLAPVAAGGCWLEAALLRRLASRHRAEAAGAAAPAGSCLACWPCCSIAVMR